MRRSVSVTSHVPVAVAAFLIAASLTGARLYSSSTGSAALAQQRAETCSADSALQLPIPAGRADAERVVRELGAALPHVAPSRRIATARPILGTNPGSKRRITLVSIEGDAQAVKPTLTPLGPDEIALSASNLSELNLAVGDDLLLLGGRRLKVAQSFDDLPTAPIPEFWCGAHALFELTAGGDLPPPSAIASLSTVESFGAFVVDEFRLTPSPLTLTEIGETERAFRSATTQWTTAFPREGDVPRNEFGRVLARARSVHTTVERNLAPVLLIALVADFVVLISAAVLVARERRRELRLLAVRGVRPARMAALAAPPLALGVAVGTLLGFGAAWLGVVLFGPSSLLESGALAWAAVTVVVASTAATVLVAVVVATVADGYADPRRTRVRSRLPATLVVAGLVALAAIAFHRLDTNGGVRTSGVRSSGGDLLAMGFPLFGVLATVGVIGLVLAWVTPRLRLSGSRWGRATRLGWRRVVLEAGPLVAVVCSVALAAGCFTMAVALSAGAHRQLGDKADVYVGTDLAVNVFGPIHVPDDWTDRVTVTSGARAKADSREVDVLGVDPTSFADVARLRSDGASRSLSELVQEIADHGTGAALPAIAVGSSARTGDEVQVVLPGTSEPVALRIVDTATFFPTKTTSVPLYVVDRSSLDALLPQPVVMLMVAHPPADAVQQLRDAGNRIGLVLSAATSFDGSAYSALRWAYVPLAVLGALFAAVALALQLLVVSARREQRRVAHVLMIRTGFDRRATWWAAVVETAVPMTLGAVTGLVGAMAVAVLGVPRLDPMPTLAPPAIFVTPWAVVLSVMVVVPLWTAVIATLITRSTERGDPMRVLQGAP
jgi:hypothetical protein